ncbi:YcnI family protein [Niveibacterium sp. SC-1]|uniref:YcnI family copper-binding membrane protein n=1 Tax=Niveibacterium sp. SC-1 TaxID=3135646 RepID=UPI0031201658
MKRLILAATAALGLGGAAQAHVVLLDKEAEAGSYFRVTLQVGHGCQGEATIGLEVTVPAGVAVARPMPKTGWKIEIEEGDFERPAMVHGKAVTSGVKRVRWVGGNLPDAWYDEFVMQVKLPEEAGVLAFPVIQRCGELHADWVELARDGKVPAYPAPALMVRPKAASAHAGH